MKIDVFNHVIPTKYKEALFKKMQPDAYPYGSLPGLMCGYAFFGADHMVCATDMLYDPERGAIYTRETIRAVEGMDILDFEKKKLFEDNASKLMQLSV
jgi:aminocarboxymuconate-semialdehyde decarboxylase